MNMQSSILQRKSTLVQYSTRSATVPQFSIKNRQCARVQLKSPLINLKQTVTSFPRLQNQAPKASSAVSNAGDSPAQADSNWKIPLYIVMWFGFNIYFNIVNKEALTVFTCPWLIATWQLVASSLFVSALWLFRLQKTPKVSKQLLIDLLPAALFHTIGHVTACVSFSLMAVSFTHVVKSAEPVFSVALSGPILGEAYPWYVWLSLLPIVAGCSLSSMKEVSFAWAGFLMAMASNFGMVLRNIYSKISLKKYKDLGGINLYGLLSMLSILWLTPAAILIEQAKWAPMWNSAVTKVGSTQLWNSILLSGLFYHLYNQSSYQVLGQGMGQVTFSVANVMKRVCVVVASVLYFRNPVSAQNWIGTAIAIGGTFLYSSAKQKMAEKSK